MSTTHGRITGRGVTMTGLASHILIGSRTNSQAIERTEGFTMRRIECFE